MAPSPAQRGVPSKTCGRHSSQIHLPNSFLGGATYIGFKNAVRVSVLQFSTQAPSRTAKLFLLSPTAQLEFRKVLAEALQETAPTGTLNRALGMTEVYMKTERPARQLRCSDHRGWKGLGWLWRGAQNDRRAHTNTSEEHLKQQEETHNTRAM